MRGLIAAATFALFATETLAGAWTRPEGDGLAILSLEGYAVPSGYDFMGTPDDDALYLRADAALYVEYGLRDWLTLGGDFRARTVGYQMGAANGARVGLSRLSGFARARVSLWDYGVASVQAGVGGALFDGDAPPLAISDEGYETEIRALAGYGEATYFGHGFVNAEVAYRRRFGASADEIRLDLTVGLKPEPWLEFYLQSFSQFGLGGAEHGGDDYDIHKLQLSIVTEISDGVSVQTGFMREIAGRNTNLGQSVFTALWVRF